MSETYPWDDPAKKIEAYKYCRWIFDGLFPQFAAAMNLAHGIDRSGKYWTILAGPWLFHHVGARYEQYVDPKCEFKTLDPIWMKDRPNGLIGKARNAYAAALEYAGRQKKIVLCDLHMSHLDAWRISAATGFRAWPMVRRSFRTGAWPPDPEPRRKFRQFQFPWGRDEFENLLVQDLPEHVPELYLEHYKTMRDLSVRHMEDPGVDRSYVSGPGWKSNERMKFQAAECCGRKDSRIISAQHGGGTGWSEVSFMEDFIRTYADKFISWGAQNQKSATVVFPDPILNRLRKKYARRKYRKKGNILFVGSSFARYASAGIRTQPMSIQVMEYFEWQERFFRTAGDLLESFLVRTYPAEYGWMNKIRLLQEFKQMRLDPFDRGIIHRLRTCKLAVIDSPQTTFLEALAMDKPCVLYFNPELWKMNEAAARKFDRLAETGMVHYTPEGAAEHVRKIATDPIGWWTDPMVSSARMKFKWWAIRMIDRWSGAWATGLNQWR